MPRQPKPAEAPGRVGSMGDVPRRLTFAPRTIASDDSDRCSQPQFSTARPGFLAVLQESSGWLGGYLVTNGWGRPLEFRLTTAVQPNRVQTALYGPTLVEYLHADVIGRTLIEKTGTKPDLIVTDSPPALALRSRIEIPVIAISAQHGTLEDVVALHHPRTSAGLFLHVRHEADRAAVEQLLERIDGSVDLSEPFARIREAVGEARKMGVTNRAA